MIPKFRAWDKELNKMFYGKIEECDDSVNIRFEHFDDYNPVYMQSTGLKDKNGVEIFEGDILENTTQLSYLGHKFEVKWNEEFASFYLVQGDYTSNIPINDSRSSYEVIGNIYENPELIFNEV